MPCHVTKTSIQYFLLHCLRILKSQHWILDAIANKSYTESIQSTILYASLATFVCHMYDFLMETFRTHEYKYAIPLVRGGHLEGPRVFSIFYSCFSLLLTGASLKDIYMVNGVVYRSSLHNK